MNNVVHIDNWAGRTRLRRQRLATDQQREARLRERSQRLHALLYGAGWPPAGGAA